MEKLIQYIEIEKCGGVGFGSDWARVIKKKVDLPLQNSFFKENTFLKKNNNYLICQFYYVNFNYQTSTKLFLIV